MPISDTYARVLCSSIIIDREGRQRKKIDTGSLKESIRLNGVINPIIVNAQLELVAGERRLTSSLELGLLDIPVRFLDELDPIERQIIELEENLKRSDLDWKDQVRAIGHIHQLYVNRDSTWTQAKTADSLGVTPGWVSTWLKVHTHIDNPRVSGCPGINAAANLLSRLDSRMADAALSDLLEDTAKAFPQEARPLDGVDPEGVQATKNPGVLRGLALAQGPLSTYPARSNPVPPLLVPKPESILNVSFLDWAPHYTGQKFNFIHCDFPYGIDAFAGSMGASGNASSADLGEAGIAGRQKHLYDDSPDTYWQLISCLCENLDKLAAHSTHLMFWFSMNYYRETLTAFAKLAPDLAFNPMPLIWMKSDNRGVLPDAKRGPRQIYETCLIASREDRLIAKAKSNAYQAPSDKQYHHSTKPEPMLRYFMEMFVDNSTRMLDPTCGSGSSLRAAESLGASSVTGLEIDPEHYESAKGALRKFRLLQGATK